MATDYWTGVDTEAGAREWFARNSIPERQAGALHLAGKTLVRELDDAREQIAALRTQLWEALGSTLVNYPEQLHEAKDRTAAGHELRTILTRHLREDERAS